MTVAWDTPVLTHCKGCGKALHPTPARNALSRYGHGYICSDCGLQEAFVGDFIKIVLKRKADKRLAEDMAIERDQMTR